jgi:hypothetical protein
MSSEKEISEIFNRDDQKVKKKKVCDSCDGSGLITAGEHVFPCPKRENHR